MDNGVAAAAAAMEKALRRLDTALGNRAQAFRALAQQHGVTAAELRAAREALEAARAEANDFRERAALVDALRQELAAMQRDETPAVPAADTEVAALKEALAAARAELAAAKAFEARMAERIDSVMARLRQALTQPAA